MKLFNNSIIFAAVIMATAVLASPASPAPSKAKQPMANQQKPPATMTWSQYFKSGLNKAYSRVADVLPWKRAELQRQQQEQQKLQQQKLQQDQAKRMERKQKREQKPKEVNVDGFFRRFEHINEQMAKQQPIREQRQQKREQKVEDIDVAEAMKTIEKPSSKISKKAIAGGVAATAIAGTGLAVTLAMDQKDTAAPVPVPAAA